MSSASKNPAPHRPAQLFILESLTYEDELMERYEGRILSQVLKLCGLQPIYFYFRTRQELEHLAGTFEQSKYRYLHISCHGAADRLSLTHDHILIEQLGTIFANRLNNGRLFVSACEVGTSRLVDGVGEKNKGMYSIMAPTEKIPFGDAIAFWTAFYVRLFREPDSAKKNASIVSTIESLRSIFSTEFHWSYFDAGGTKQWKCQTI